MMDWDAAVPWLGWAVAALLLVLALKRPQKRLVRKPSHRHASNEAQFRREMGVLLGPAIVPGNRVRDLHNGDDIFPAMLDAVESARVSITFETYIYWSGDVGRELAQRLAGKARAGVPVHVLVDWVGSLKMDGELLALLVDAGVHLHRYRPLHWYHLGRLNNRTHRKLLVIDGRIAFTGGVGIADQWRGHAQDADHWRDIHFQIEGPVVAQCQAAFNDNWIKTTGQVLHGPAYFPELPPAGSMDAHLFVSSPAGGSESMHLMVLMALAAANHRICLQAAYFVPDRLVIDALLAACARGVRVQLMVPGPHIDSEAVRLSSRRHWGELLRAGVQIHEYQPTMMHNKLLIIDTDMVSVGSTNFDERSFRLNDEASMNVYDTGFARRMIEVFEADLAHAPAYTLARWHERPLRQRLGEWLLRPVRSQL